MTLEQHVRRMKLTRREMQLLLLLAKHWEFCNKELANALCVGESTIKHHFVHIHEKFGFARSGNYEKRMRLIRWLWEHSQPEAP